MKKLEKQPRSFGLVIKHNVPRATQLALEVAEWLESRQCKVFVADEAAEFRKQRVDIPAVPKEELPAKCEMAIVFGGDGTFLSLARLMIWKTIPVIGVNLGQLGFLTEIKVEEIYDTLEEVLMGNYRLQERTMLEACVRRDGKELFCLPVLNDVVITKSAIARVIDFDLALNGVQVARLKADGLIVSTPTGSTAYSLAAGGPIMHPQVNGTVITAICPHSLNVRPIVIPDDAEITVKLLQKDGDIMLTLDGQFGYELHQGDVVSVTKYARHKLQIVQSAKRDYFELLRTKLKLGIRGGE